MRRSLKGFTMVEIVVVIIIISILLLITLNLWWDYVRTMEVKTDKESLTGTYNNITTTARTSNFFKWVKYESVDIWFAAWWITSLNDNGEVFWITELTKSILVFSWVAPTITMEPYSIWCSISVGTGVDFSLVSTINDDEYCFSISDSTCKMLQISCD